MDIGNSVWNESDASNTTAAPDGAPEGMSPSGVNDVLRAHQGAIKRAWNHANYTATSGGTSSAMTLTYSVAPAAYYDGEIFSFIAGAAVAAGATLNVNALGAKSIRHFGGAVMAGAFQSGEAVRVRYNSSAGAFDIISKQDMSVLSIVSPSAASTVDFTSIPTTVSNIRLDGEVTVSAADLLLARCYGTGGTLDTGSNYAYALTVVSSGGVGSSLSSGTSFLISGAADTGTYGVSFSIQANNIQASTYTKFNGQSQYATAGSITAAEVHGAHAVAANITGVRIFPQSGTVTGRVVLRAMQ